MLFAIIWKFILVVHNFTLFQAHSFYPASTDGQCINQYLTLLIEYINISNFLDPKDLVDLLHC